MSERQVQYADGEWSREVEVVPDDHADLIADTKVTLGMGVNPTAAEVRTLLAALEATVQERDDLEFRLRAARTWQKQADTLAAVVKRVRELADKAEHGATRWADPLPVPVWVERVRQILDAPTVSLAEHDAQVLEAAADAVPVDLWVTFGMTARRSVEGFQDWLRERAARLREKAGR